MNLVRSITGHFSKQKPGAKAAVIVVILLAQCCICILPFTVMSMYSGGEMVGIDQPAAQQEVAAEKLPAAQQEVAAEKLPAAQQEVAAEKLPVAQAAYHTAVEGDAVVGLAWLFDRFPALGSALQWMAAPMR